MKEFAPDYYRNDEGWIVFPDDVAYRKDMFPASVKTSKHVAKANLFLVQSIITFVSEPEQTVMDIMAGTGTIMVAALVGRDVIAIDISPEFCQIMEAGLEHLEKIAPGISGRVMILNAPCQTILPLPADHIIFSPPYGDIMKSKGKDKLTLEKTPYHMAEYYQGVLNVGAVNEWLYHQLMERVYNLCHESLPQDGTLTIIIKDHIEKGQRVALSQKAADYCLSIGFDLVGWYKQPVLGSVYTRIYRSQGKLTVDDEDIVILRKK